MAADFTNIINTLQTAVYGKDVRSALIAMANAVSENIILVDTSLSKSGYAADAYTVGTQLDTLTAWKTSATSTLSSHTSSLTSVTSRVSTLENNMSNYYTSSQVDSAIANAATSSSSSVSALATRVTTLESTTEDLDDEIEDVETDLEYQTGTKRISISNDGYILLGGVSIGNTVDVSEPVSSSSYKYAIESCTEGDIFILNVTGGGNPRAWGFVDSSYTLLSVSKASLVASNLMLIAPTNASYIIINSQKSGIGVCYKGHLATTISDIDSRLENVEAMVNTVDGSSVVKELYIPDLQDYTSIGVQAFLARLSSSDNKYFSEIRIWLSDSVYGRVCYMGGYDTQTGASDTIQHYNNVVYPFSVLCSDSETTISGHILFDVSSMSNGTKTDKYTLDINRVINISYSPRIANIILKESIGHRICEHPVDNAINASNTYQASYNFKDDDVKVYANGLLLNPSLYNVYKQGKIAFTSTVSYSNSDLMLDYFKYQRTYTNFDNDLSTNLAGFYLHEVGDSDMCSFVADPSGEDSTVLKISSSSTITDTLLRCQLMKDVSYTDYYEQIQVYFPQELLDAMISYSDYIHWFGMISAWSPYGPTTGETSDLYSGSSNFVQLYKSTASSSTINYHVMNRKRTTVGGVESYTTIAENVSSFEVLGDEWITLTLHIVTGNPGTFDLTVEDSSGTHTLSPLRSGSSLAYVGVADPENESSLYGSSIISDVPYRATNIINAAKIYTSASIANHIISKNGEIAVYYKNHKEYSCKNINAF